MDGKLDLAMQWAFEQEEAGGEVNFKEGLAFYSSIGILQVCVSCVFVCIGVVFSKDDGGSKGLGLWMLRADFFFFPFALGSSFGEDPRSRVGYVKQCLGICPCVAAR